MKIHHIGMAVPEIKKAAESLVTLGGKVISPVYEDEHQKSLIQFVDLGGLTIELLAPNASDSPVSQSVKARRRLYHLCYEVDHLDEEVKRWASLGAVMVSEPKPAVAFDGRRVAFFMTKEGDLFELLEGKNEHSL